MRSGWHAEWDAHMVTGRERAELAERMRRLAAAFAPMRAAFASFGVSVAQAAKGMREAERALARIGAAQRRR